MLLSFFFFYLPSKRRFLDGNPTETCGNVVATMWQRCGKLTEMWRQTSVICTQANRPVLLGWPRMWAQISLMLFQKKSFSLRSRDFFLETWDWATPKFAQHGDMLLCSQKKKRHTPRHKKDFFLSIAGCVVDQKFVSIDLDIAHCYDFACRFFVGDFFIFWYLNEPVINFMYRCKRCLGLVPKSCYDDFVAWYLGEFVQQWYHLYVK